MADATQQTKQKFKLRIGVRVEFLCRSAAAKGKRQLRFLRLHNMPRNGNLPGLRSLRELRRGIISFAMRTK